MQSPTGSKRVSTGSHGLQDSDFRGEYYRRLDLLNTTYEERLPPSLSRDVLAYSPRVLQNVLEIEKQKALIALEDDDKAEKVLLSSSVWPSSTRLECSLMLADVSGFCKISEFLCAQGVEGLDKLRTSINDCFSSLIETISKYGGDILNFAGDALIIGWFNLTPSEDMRAYVAGTAIETEKRKDRICAVQLRQYLLEEEISSNHVIEELTLRSKLSSLACVRCGLELAALEPPFDTQKLKLHVGVASGLVTLYVTGGLQMEFQCLTISPIFKELGNAVTAAGPKQLVIAPSTANKVKGMVETTESEQAEGYYLVTDAPQSMWESHVGELESLFQSNAAEHKAIPARLSEASDSGVFEVDVDRMAVCKALAFVPPPPEIDVDSPTPFISVEAEIREVTVVFMKMDGPRIDAALEDGSGEMLSLVENIMGVAQSVTQKYNAMMRQFLVDDKGMVMILALGVPKCVHLDDKIRGVKVAVEICQGLAGLEVETFAGVTTGKAYIGSVGNKSRREYALVGDSVNLAARLMSFACKTYKASYSVVEEGESETKMSGDAMQRVDNLESAMENALKNQDQEGGSYCFSNKKRGTDGKHSLKLAKDRLANSFVVVCDEETHSGSQKVFDFEKYTNVKIKGKSNVTAFEVLSADTMHKTQRNLVEKVCIGFDPEFKYVKSLLRLKEVKRRVSLLSSTVYKESGPLDPIRAQLLGASDGNKKDPHEERILKETVRINSSDTRRHSQVPSPHAQETNKCKKRAHSFSSCNTKSGEGKEGKEADTEEKQKESMFESESDESDAEDSPEEEKQGEEKQSEVQNEESNEAAETWTNLNSHMGEPGARRRTELNILEARTGSRHNRRSTGRLSMFKKKGGIILVIKGDEGGGKSTFLNHVCSSAASSGLLSVFIKLRPTDHYQPYSALSHIFFTLFQQDSVKRMLAGVDGFFDKVVDEWEEALSDSEKVALPTVKNLLKFGSWNISGWTPINSLRQEGNESHELIQQVILKLFLSSTFLIFLNDKIILSIDDIHFMDSCSWELLIRVITCERVSMLMFCTANNSRNKRHKGAHGPRGFNESITEGTSTVVKQRDLVNVTTHDFSNGVGELQTITLGHLKPDDISLVVKSAFPDTKWTPEELRNIFELSVGHPFVAIEIARSVRSNVTDLAKLRTNFDDGKDKTQSVDRIASQKFSNSEAIVKAFTARIDSLSNPEQRCLKAASVIGVEFEYDTLLEVVPRSFLRLREDKTTQLDSILADLVEADFIHISKRWEDEKGRMLTLYEFTHSKLQQTCYNLLLRADQIMYHKQVANWISQRYQDDLRKFYIPLMYHLTKANDFDKAMDYAVGSIKQSVWNGAFSECKVILDEVVHYVADKKLKSRTTRMILNALKHILQQHQEYQSQTMESSGKQQVKRLSTKYLPSKRILIMDGDDDRTSEHFSDFDGTSSETEGESRERVRESRQQKKNALGFRSEAKNNNKVKGTFWIYFEEVIHKLEFAIAPVVSEKDTSMKKSKSKATAKTSSSSSSSSRTCAIQ